MPHSWWARIVLLAALPLTGAPGAGLAEAPSREQLATVQEYVELLHLAHERYGEEVVYRDLTYAAIQGMMRDLDPHTSFLTPESYDNMRQRQQGSFYGLGLLVSKRNGRLTVVAPLEGTPAFRQGMRSGDVIQTIEDEPTEAMTLDEAVSRLKGPKGTEVRITVVRPGANKPLALTVQRAEIPQDTVRYAYRMTPEVGYVRLTDFSRSTAEEMRETLARLRREGIEKLLLDLRSNGGGLLDAAVAVADLFLPANSRIVETRGRLPSSFQEYLDDEGDPDPELGLPLVVLVNSGTASAAEILAGTIQDHDVGLIVGTPTWGKGLVQTVYNLSYGTGVALTTAKYHTPSGRLIQRDYGSYYDYYDRRSETGDDATDESGAPRQEFLTDLGRSVYGGGGIMPDVFVELPDAPATLQVLYAYNAFFDFAVDYHRRRPVTTEDWQPGDEILDEFGAWLRERGILDEGGEDPLADEAARDFIRRQIHSDLFTAAFGTQASHRVLAKGDAQIQAALGLFDRAADLLARRDSLADGAPERRSGSETTPSGRAPTSPSAVPAPRPELWPAELSAAERFVRAKLLADAGEFKAALEAFRESIELDAAAYNRIELARFHTDLAQLSRDDDKRRWNLETAAREASMARQAAPDNPDVLSSFAQAHVRLFEADGAPGTLALARDAYLELRERVPDDVRALASLGQIYLWQQEPALAVEVLRAARSYQPGYKALDGMLIEALLGAGDLDGAEAELVEILARRPAAAEMRLRLAELYSERGDHRRAAEVLLEAPPAARSRPAIRRSLARELHLAGSDEEALQVVDGLLAETPTPGLRRLRVASLSALLRYEEALAELYRLAGEGSDAARSRQDKLLAARLLERLGRAEEAAARLRELAGGSPGAVDTEALLALTGVLEREGRVDEAVAALGEALAKASDETAPVLGRALVQALVGARRFDEALAAAGERAGRGAKLLRLTTLVAAERWEEVARVAATLEDSSDARLRESALVVGAEALARLGRIDEALERLDREARAGGSKRLLTKRVEILFDHGRADQARAQLESVTARGTPEDLLFVARIHQAGERWQEAIPLFEQVLEREPTSREALFGLGAALERTDHRRGSAGTFQRLLELEPDHAPALNYLGYMWVESGENLEQALVLIRRAVALDPDNGAYVDSLGWAYFRLGRADEARQHLEWAARLLPHDPTTLEHLGDVYAGQRELDRARATYQRALDAGDPDELEQVRRKLSALEE